MGASGSGTSTLARALASELATQAFDTDDFYWRPTDPPFTEKRPIPERLALMEDLFLPRSDWVLSGSMAGWGDPIIPRLTHVVFLTLDAETRLDRLGARERDRYGAEIAPGGPRERAYRSFMEWAASYDTDGTTGRSRVQHEAWLVQLPCPVIRLDVRSGVELLVRQTCDALDRGGASA